MSFLSLLSLLLYIGVSDLEKVFSYSWKTEFEILLHLQFPFRT